MTWAGWRQELRRIGWVGLYGPLAAVALGAVFSVGAALLHMGGQINGIQRGMLDFLWLSAGLSAAALAGEDRALELQLSLPTPFRVTVGRRLTIALVWLAVVAAALAGYLAVSGRDLRIGAWNEQLAWLAPCAVMAAVGALARVTLRSSPASFGLIGVVWIFFEILPPSMARLALVRPWLLRYPIVLASPEGWYLNRALLVGIALAAALGAHLALGRPDRLLEGDA